GKDLNIFSEWICDHADFVPRACMAAISARGAMTFFSNAASSFRAVISRVCFGQVVRAPISDCSAAATPISVRFSTKLWADAQSVWPLDMSETAGFWPD